jgi:hypothetical protein
MYLPWSRYLTFFPLGHQVTDQPRERPNFPIPISEREKHIILSLSVPPPSRAADTLPLVTALFALVDALPKVSLRPETKAKVKRTREEVDKEIKEDSEKDKKDEVGICLLLFCADLYPVYLTYPPCILGCCRETGR